MIKLSTIVIILFIVAILATCGIGKNPSEGMINSKSAIFRFLQHDNTEKTNNAGDNTVGTKWAVLVAGSNGYWNYRHQADVCHAYQILKKGGLKDENIIVFMYDDIAKHKKNPRPGVIINSPNGTDVYQGVPKDYTGLDVNSHNFYAVLRGDKSAISGGSRKVLESGPNDNIFIYYADHGGAGSLGMPSFDDSIYANDLIDVLKKMHSSRTYKNLVFYVEACEAGSMFDGLLSDDLNIYAVTASRPGENSYAYYCPHDVYGTPAEYNTCLGDLFSISWLEDCDYKHMNGETFLHQYRRVYSRTKKGGSQSSHVMRYGDVFGFMGCNLSSFMGTIPRSSESSNVIEAYTTVPKLANQHEAEILHLWTKFQRAPEGSSKKLEAHKKLDKILSHRNRIDNNVRMVGEALFGDKKASGIMSFVRPSGQPLVDDWDCLKSMVKTFETHCGVLSRYGRRHMRAFANICNAGIAKEQMAEASGKACRRGTTLS